MTDVDVFLAHYGVKGMRWGIRKDPETAAPSQGHYRTMIEASYLKKGLSLEEAKVKTEKALRIQKAVAITAGVAVASIVTYGVATKIGKEFTGVYIKEGTTLQHISKSDTLNLTDQHLYTTFKKADKFNYQGTFATEMGALNGVQNHAIKLATKNAVKAPSNVAAQKLLGEVRGKAVSKAEYREFIGNFYKKSSTEGEMGKFKDLLGQKGFNAVIDTTDQNGYARAFKPIIVFNSQANAVQRGSRALSSTEVSAKLLTTRFSQLVASPDSDFAIKAGVGAAVVGGMRAGQVRNQNMAIDKYLTEHPDSKLTRSQVAVTLKLV